ncbi:MAG: helicase-exonuclease AddAB subunit AddA [Lachnospiraceae bacterium]|nr:helicase-exonuclease AddAB subunit AddA [Lachnospiraceae bacterium]
MAVSWTEDQRLAIDQAEKNILISAAAGSGKTAVLVERILRIVTDLQHPVDVDRLLIVTFTRAAAQEMKDRIGRALEERLQQDPENEHLQKQGILLQHAQISTIHGFCTYVIQNYFHQIGLDPGYRIAEDSELTMMKRDVLGEILEAEYEKGDPAFLNFIEAFSNDRSDRQIEDLILRFYEAAISDPDPDGWMEHCRQVYESDTEEELEKSQWLQNGMKEARALLLDVRDRVLMALELAMDEKGPYEYLPAIERDLEQVDALLQLEGYGSLVSACSKLEIQTLSRKKMTGVDEKLKARVSELRGTAASGYRKSLTNIRDKYFALPLKGILEEVRNCRENAFELVRLTRLFAAGYTEIKRKNNVLDFSDLEHLALEILLEKKGDVWKRRPAAKEIAEQFYEIMIDEYQDSNFVQEALLQAVSGEEEGRFNRFMVGDIKQSIYGFRKAKPELFLEKYHAYREADHATRIDLKQNFRSRQEVLSSVNVLFQRLMVPDLGGIEYDDAAALHQGFSYPETPAGNCDTEVILIDRKDPDLAELTLKEDRVEIEAMVVAEKIREIMGTQKVYDRKTDGFRPAQYRDFAVLLRSFSGKAEVFLRVLKNEGIPCFAVSKSGYFKTIEVSTILNYLRVLDNPRQDIPYAAVLRSPIVGLKDEELALLTTAAEGASLFEAVPKLLEDYRAERKERTKRSLPETLFKKLDYFYAQLEEFRDLVPCIPVHELVNLVLDGTGYRNLAGSLPMGEQRLANLNLLVEKAVDFEATSYHGLFHFLRYLDQMEKNKIDFGEVNLYGETADAVTILTIHKSKGLEYPFVFVSDLCGSFNVMDERTGVVFQSDLGMGLNYVDLEKRVRHDTMLKRMIGQKIHQEMLAEELRVLYVALTRAKEKLILTSLVDNLEKRVKECAQTPSLKTQPLPYGRLSSAKSYLDWILPIVAETEGFQPVYQMFLGDEHPSAGIDAPIRVFVQTPGGVAEEKVWNTMEKAALHAAMQEIGSNPEEVYEAEVRAFLEKKQNWEYPWQYRNILPPVVSVSELKKKRPSQSEEEVYAVETGLVAEQVALYGIQKNPEEEPEEDVYLPAFMRNQEEEKTGAAKGTAYHRFFECVNYKEMPEDQGQALENFIEEQIGKMLSEEKLEQKEADCIDRTELITFFKSRIGRRMYRAALDGKLYREQSFLMDLPAVELDPEWNYPERILIRGIIDACFEEDGKLVIVDYKTDKVYSRNGRCLIRKYAKQLHYYQKALEKGRGLPVKEKIIYSVALGKEIAVPDSVQYNNK